MKDGLPDEVFQAGALSVAKLHLNGSGSIQELANQLWEGYRRQVNDSEAVDDWVAAATAIVLHLGEISHEHPVGVLHCAQYFCMNFDDEGKRRKKGLLGGLWFSSASDAASRKTRVGSLLKKFERYRVAADAGLDVPMPPDGWHP